MLDENAYLNIEYSEGNLLVGIVGEVDHHSARALREKIDRHLYLYRPKTFTLSLAGVSFMDSSGLGLILGRLSLAEDLGSKMLLTDVNERNMKILSLAGLLRISALKIVDSRTKAEITDAKAGVNVADKESLCHVESIKSTEEVK